MLILFGNSMECRYSLDSMSSNSRVDLDKSVDGALKLSETLLLVR